MTDNGVLDGLRVLDASQLLPGPWAVQILDDLDVINGRKVWITKAGDCREMVLNFIGQHVLDLPRSY